MACFAPPKCCGRLPNASRSGKHYPNLAPVSTSPDPPACSLIVSGTRKCNFCWWTQELSGSINMGRAPTQMACQPPPSATSPAPALHPAAAPALHAGLKAPGPKQSHTQTGAATQAAAAHTKWKGASPVCPQSLHSTACRRLTYSGGSRSARGGRQGGTGWAAGRKGHRVVSKTHVWSRPGGGVRSGAVRKGFECQGPSHGPGLRDMLRV